MLDEVNVDIAEWEQHHVITDSKEWTGALISTSKTAKNQEGCVQNNK